MPHDARRDIHLGRSSLAQVTALFEHRVPQSRFATNNSLDINLRVSDRFVSTKIDGPLFPWAEWTRIGRGVELGKSGRVQICRSCSIARPQPRVSTAAPCKRCGNEHWALADEQRIIGPLPTIRVQLESPYHRRRRNAIQRERRENSN